MVFRTCSTKKQDAPIAWRESTSQDEPFRRGRNTNFATGFPSSRRQVMSSGDAAFAKDTEPFSPLRGGRSGKRDDKTAVTNFKEDSVEPVRERSIFIGRPGEPEVVGRNLLTHSASSVSLAKTPRRVDILKQRLQQVAPG